MYSNTTKKLAEWGQDSGSRTLDQGSRILHPGFWIQTPDPHVCGAYTLPPFYLHNLCFIWIKMGGGRHFGFFI